MAKNEIHLSLQKEMESLARSIKKVTAAIFSDKPGVSPKIVGKRKSAQITFKIHSAGDKRSILSQARRTYLNEFMRANGAEIEMMMNQAMRAVIAGLVGIGGSRVSVFGRSLGMAKPHKRIEDEAFARFIKGKAGAGEIGLPDPSESLHQLKAALFAALTVDVVTRGKHGPQIKFVFDQKRLLKMTPHPNQKDGSGKSSAFYSWLSLVTGPGFLNGGTPGFGLVRVKDLREGLKSSKSMKKGGVRSMRRAQITESLIRSSRTHGNAGEMAGIMMSTKSKKGKSPALSFGGTGEDYHPDAKFNGFWDIWWTQIKPELSVWSKRVMSATIQGILRKR